MIDKSHQILWFLEKQSPLRIVSNVDCSTGQADGDKVAEGDLKTPEGVYFVEQRIDQDLDFELYGDLAFALNFPNPVDRMQGKTGHGIWLHGRGKELVPRDTKGCVALNTETLAGYQDLIEYRMTPVVIGEQAELDILETDENGRESSLTGAVADWAAAWQAKADSFFSFYHPEKFAKSTGRAFRFFEAHKKRLFSQYPWIHVFLGDVRVVSGPGYWVTYFGQYYRTPSFESEGVKRLYWQESEEGFRIVGSEWLPADLELKVKYRDIYRARLSEFVESWRRSWEQADLDGYLAHYAGGSRQDEREGVTAIMDHKLRLWAQDAPATISLADLHMDTHPQGFAVDVVQHYRARSGYEDLGVKRLVISPGQEGFEIVEETWRQVEDRP